MKALVPFILSRNNWGRSEAQAGNIVMITFWSQFSVYSLNTILVLFLTRPLFQNGLGYNEGQAYAFIGTSQALGYLMPLLGGYMADNVLGVRRSILIGSTMLALAYLLIMLSGFTIKETGDTLFLIAYAMVPATNALLVGTSSGMVTKIYSQNALKAKSAMTFYYMAINVGSLLATTLSPKLMETAYGPLSVLTIAFIGKSIAALNFASRYSLYEDVVWGKDLRSFSKRKQSSLVLYLSLVYCFTLFAYFNIRLASYLIEIFCIIGLAFFVKKTLQLQRAARLKQLLALVLILQAIVFFILYNQMNSTLILFAERNSSLTLLGFSVSPAHYQMLNPMMILLFGMGLPKWYQKFPQFTISYQFATGILLSTTALLLLAGLCAMSSTGIINGNWLALVYSLISLAELLVSAIGLSMIGLYCDQSSLAFAMGVWYITCSLGHAISGCIAQWAAIPHSVMEPQESILIYERYFTNLGIIGGVTGIVVLLLAVKIAKYFRKQNIPLH